MPSSWKATPTNRARANTTWRWVPAGQRVQNYMISQGVAPARIRTVSYGKERPVEVCSVESCYAKNRRAVTVLSAGQGA